MVELLLATATFIAGVVLSTVSKIFLQEPLHHFLARIIFRGLPRPGRHVKGIWECCYRYPSKNTYNYKHTYKYEQQLMHLTQVGQSVEARNVTSQSHNHRLSGRLTSSTYLTGTWENISEGEIWHGTFQFVLHPTGTSMLGKWLGFDSEGKVEHGPWAWRLVTRDTAKASVRNLRNSWTPDSTLMAWCQPPEESLKDLVSKYGRAWEKQDVGALTDLFTTDAEYQEGAFTKPLKGLSEIQEYWRKKVIKEQGNIRFQILSIYGGGNTGVAEWEAEFDNLQQKVRKQIQEVALLELSDGKISKLKEYWSSKRIRTLT